MPSKSIIKVIREHQKFLVTTHLNPDADAICSALAMTAALKALGKTVVVVNEHAVPKWLSFLPDTDWFKVASKLKTVDYDVAIVVDCGDLARAGSSQKLIDQAKPLINIDHHITNAKFGTHAWVDAKASSTAEILYELIKLLKVKLTKNMSILLYAGIMTDTGSFRFDCTTAKTHQIVGELLKFNFSVSEIYGRIYDVIPAKDLKAFLKIINGDQMLSDGRLACVKLPKKTLKKISSDFDVKEKIFSLLRSTQGVEVVVILTESSSKHTRVNLRSQGSYDVARLASQFGGGGHMRASGCGVDAGLTAATKIVTKQILKEL